MGWSVFIGTQGGVLANYTTCLDFEFFDALYEYGGAIIVLGGVGSNPVPVQGNIVKIVWDSGLASEQTHWQGFLVAVPKKENNVYVLRALTLDAKLHLSQTGSFRNYLARTPHSIIQAAGTPSPLLVNAAGATVMVYGTSASVPNKVETTNDRMGTFSGTIANDQFVADSTTLLENIRRLCMQARYTNDAAPDGSSDADTDGSYGLEWTTTLEGANGSDPRFYLVKRRESRVGYTPEVFNIPNDFPDCRRGGEQTPGVDSVKAIGGGDGESRVESAFIGAGAREYIVEDKAIFKTTNATNLATRYGQIYSNAVDLIVTTCYRNASPTRAGDTITVTQTGVANLDLRVMLRHYRLANREWSFIVGRPAPTRREHLTTVANQIKTDTTTPQYTDVKPETLFEGGATPSQYHITSLSAPVVVGAGAGGVLINSAVHTVLAGSNLANLGESEGFLVQVVLDVDAAVVSAATASGNHNHPYDKTTSITIGTTDAAGGGATPEPHGHTATPNHTSTATGNQSAQPTITPTMAGPFLAEIRLVFAGGTVILCQRTFPHLPAPDRYFDLGTYQFAAADPADPTNFTPLRVELFVINYGAHAITFGGTGNRATSCQVGIWKDTLHRHNEL